MLVQNRLLPSLDRIHVEAWFHGLSDMTMDFWICISSKTLVLSCESSKLFCLQEGQRVIRLSRQQDVYDEGYPVSL